MRGPGDADGRDLQPATPAGREARDPVFGRLQQAGFEVLVRNHAGAIFSVDFPAEAAELTAALLEMRIPARDLIASGGGEAGSTRWLRQRLQAAGWRKHNFRFQQFVDGMPQVSRTHEIDHVRRGASGVIALEIEWNNKDPFFDRDLENFQRLHAQSAISLGVIVTRGAALQAALPGMVRRFLESHGVRDEAGLEGFGLKDRTRRQSALVARQTARGTPFAQAFAHQFVHDKFGMATTHWAKLVERVARGVGNPCPLLLIGLPAAIVEAAMPDGEVRPEAPPALL